MRLFSENKLSRKAPRVARGLYVNPEGIYNALEVDH